jgi:ferredoxin
MQGFGIFNPGDRVIDVNRWVALSRAAIMGYAFCLFTCCAIGPGFAMALIITDQCINCDVCEPECPNEAIYMGPEIYEIDPNKCTECVGHFDEPQCMQVCPVSCIPVNPDFVEDRETLWEKYRRLQLAAATKA